MKRIFAGETWFNTAYRRCSPCQGKASTAAATDVQEIKILLAGMLEKSVIWESRSPWDAPIVFGRKKDGSFCVDYRKLSAVTHKDAFPFPRLKDTQTCLTKAKWFITLDPAGRLALPLPWNYAFLALQCSSNISTVDTALLEWPDIWLSPGLLGTTNSILIWFLFSLLCIWKRSSRDSGNMRLDNSKLFQHEEKFPWHVVDKTRVRPETEKNSALWNWPTPTTVRQDSLFGLAGY